MDLVSPSSGIKPAAAVLVTTVQSVQQQAAGDTEHPFANLEKHIAILRSFNLPTVVAINRFPNDTEAQLDELRIFCEARGVSFALSEAFTKGGEGAAALARKVVETIEANPTPTLTTTYQPTDSVIEKITRVARTIYGADAIELTPRAQENLARFTRWGFGELPICIAKTQYSLSDDPKRLGAPTGWTLHVTDIALSAGRRLSSRHLRSHDAHARAAKILPRLQHRCR